MAAGHRLFEEREVRERGKGMTGDGGVIFVSLDSNGNRKIIKSSLEVTHLTVALPSE